MLTTKTQLHQEVIKRGVNLAKLNFSYPPPRVAYNSKSRAFVSYGLGIKNVAEVTPWVAIHELLYNRANLDCERTILAIALFAVAQVHGEQDFNSMLSELRISSTLNFATVPYSAKSCITVTKVSSVNQIQLGDWIYIENHKDYLKYYRGGTASGEHVICTSLSPLLFYGLFDLNERTIDQWLLILNMAAPIFEVSEMEGIKKDQNGDIMVRRLCI